ncbi:hypothetical protein [Sphingobacterium cavernae]|uniref:hypothetical protein n=1 Tax=Sphingobacterium cavernae TaxID=2592657 RepID=UPI00122FB776|nr:hypothetical protein [Sphingobacterium cavernae]
MGGNFIESTFLGEFLKKDVLTILIALFGLNIAILSILITKLSDVKKQLASIDITEISYEMKFSMVEFIVNISLAVVSLIFYNSNSIVFPYKELLFQSTLLSTLIYSLVIIWDTGKSIFILIDEEDKI